MSKNTLQLPPHHKKPIPMQFVMEFNRGVKCMEEAKAEQAEVHFGKAAKLCPEAWLGVACLAMAEGRNAEAVTRLTQALDAATNHITKAMCLNQLAVICLRGGVRPDALKYCKASLENYKNAPATGNMALAYKAMCRIPEAITWIERAIMCEPRRQEFYFTKALLHLLIGNMTDGFREYECRWDNPESKSKKLAVIRPQWCGEPLQGKTILVYGEQGMGDTIQMLRYCPLLKARGASVIAAPQIGLEQVCARMDCFDAIYVDILNRISKGNVPFYDCQIPFMSLPHAFKTTLDSIPPAPYLPADGWPMCELPKNGKFKVGISWAGSPNHDHDRWRSMDLDDWKPLFDTDAEFYSLQVGPRTMDLMMGDYPVQDLQAMLKGFETTASVISQLDLVIAVDTSIIHLAGAMGKPVWMMTPFLPDWRWLMDREDSPWYPSLRLFRAPGERDWEPVVQSVKTALEHTIQNHDDTIRRDQVVQARVDDLQPE